MLNIAVCIKQVPDAQGAVVDKKTGTIQRGSSGTIMNPDDLHALEMALSLKDTYGAAVAALTMGPPQAEYVLREAFSLGADRGVLITDRRFAGSDSLVTSRIISRALTLLGGFDIVITGVESLDGGTGNVGYQLSEFLNMPLVTRIHKIEIKDGHAVIERLYGHEYQKIKAALPVILSVNKETNTVRFPSLADINTRYEMAVSVLTMEDIGGDGQEYGLPGSPTAVLGYEAFVHTRGHEILEGSPDEKTDALFQKLIKHSIMRY